MSPTARLLVVLLAIVAINSIAKMLHVPPSPVVSIISGLCSAAFGFGVLIPLVERIIRSPKIQRLVGLMRAPRVREFAIRLAIFVFRNPFPLAAFVVLSVWGKDQSEFDALPLNTQAALAAIFVLGSCWILGGLLSRIVGFNTDSVTRYLIQRASQFALVTFTICHFGTEFSDGIALVRNNPEIAISVGAAWSMLRMAFRQIPATRRVGKGARDPFGASPVALINLFRRRSQADIRRTSAHEAGHLLVFGLLETLPHDLSVCVKTKIGMSDWSQGWVAHSEEPTDYQTEDSLQWHMLLNLAGSEAELAILGNRANGSSEDFEKWLAAAVTYLSNGFGEVYYEIPRSKAQRTHNRDVLNTLKAACVDHLHELFAKNRELMMELTDAIVAEKSLSIEGLRPFLTRVENGGRRKQPKPFNGQEQSTLDSRKSSNTPEISKC